MESRLRSGGKGERVSRGENFGKEENMGGVAKARERKLEQGSRKRNLEDFGEAGA